MTIFLTLLMICLFAGITDAEVAAVSTRRLPDKGYWTKLKNKAFSIQITRNGHVGVYFSDCLFSIPELLLRLNPLRGTLTATGSICKSIERNIEDLENGKCVVVTVYTTIGLKFVKTIILKEDYCEISNVAITTGIHVGGSHPQYHGSIVYSRKLSSEPTIMTIYGKTISGGGIKDLKSITLAYPNHSIVIKSLNREAGIQIGELVNGGNSFFYRIKVYPEYVPETIIPGVTFGYKFRIVKKTLRKYK